MSFLLFALPCFSCKDAPLTGSCVPKPGVETRHSRFVGRDNPSPLRGTRALNWPAMAALLHFLTASVRAGLSLRSLLTHFLGGPSTSTARSIKGGEGEVTLHQMACHLSPHIACLLTGRHQPSVSQRLVFGPQTSYNRGGESKRGYGVGWQLFHTPRTGVDPNGAHAR